jgi:hypothetical protein
MLIKKAHTLEELFMYLEALEMLDMEYTIQKLPESDAGDIILPLTWVIEYWPIERQAKKSPIEYED